MKIIDKNGAIVEATFEDELGRNALRHTASHILAQAVKRLYPDTKLAIGPSIENGFYYDFDRETPFAENALNREVRLGLKAHSEASTKVPPCSYAQEMARRSRPLPRI